MCKLNYSSNGRVKTSWSTLDTLQSTSNKSSAFFFINKGGMKKKEGRKERNQKPGRCGRKKETNDEKQETLGRNCACVKKRNQKKKQEM